MKFRIEITEEEFALFERFAKIRWQSVPEMVRDVIVENFEDTVDLLAFEETIVAHRRNPFVYSLDEVKRELGVL